MTNLSPTPDTPQQHRTLWRRLVFPFFGILLPLLIFGGFADEIHEAENFSFDIPVLQAVHAHTSPLLTRFVMGVTLIGGPGLWPFGLGVFVLLWWMGRRRIAGFWLTATGGAALLNLAAKSFFGRERPHLWASPAPETSWSFPSGHAMGSMAICVALCVLAWKTRWRWPMLAFSIVFVPLIAWTRLYLGVHYPSDLLAGWAASLGWVLGARWAWRSAFRSVERKL